MWALSEELRTLTRKPNVNEENQVLIGGLQKPIEVPYELMERLQTLIKGP